LKDGSQAQQILSHLVRGRTLTPLQALEKFDCLRLGGRIHQLRRRGHKIKREMIELRNNKHVARYSLPSARA
jgi:hypothetical protein